jgi:pimeloyl-ACP methyl ester carboxylesterase
MNECVERKIHVPGFSIALKIWNPHHENPVLCFPGKMDNAASFDLIAPFLPNRQIIAVDFPGTGYSSHYPEGVLPNWKNDALLMLHVINELKLANFDIIAHSLGSLIASSLAITTRENVGKIVFLDILGPTVNFIEKRMDYLPRDVETYLLSTQHSSRTLFQDKAAAISDRMRIGNISFQAAEALVLRGTIQHEKGWQWTFDQRLRCVSSTLPFEDELRSMFKSIETSILLIRAQKGVPYPETIYQERAECIKNMTLEMVDGGHHVHMDDPKPIARLIETFLKSS